MSNLPTYARSITLPYNWPFEDFSDDQKRSLEKSMGKLGYEAAKARERKVLGVFGMVVNEAVPKDTFILSSKEAFE